MKICPVCKSTYTDETLSYCLTDGAILSAMRDPHETQRISGPHNTDPAPTEVLPSSLRPTEAAPILEPTIAAPRHPFYPERSSSQAHSQEGQNKGRNIVMGVLLGFLLAGAVAGAFLWLGNNNRLDNQSPSRNSNTGANTNTTSNSTIPTSTPAILPGDHWQECENYLYDICGDWLRDAKGQWHGQWGDVRSDLTITVNGKNVTVKRRDQTSPLEATYRGTLNADNTQINGTVEWCCDTLGDRKGTWRAQINSSSR